MAEGEREEAAAGDDGAATAGRLTAELAAAILGILEETEGRRFQTDRPGGRRRFALWCGTVAAGRFPACADLIRTSLDLAPPRLSSLALVAWLERADLRSAFDPRRRAGRAGLLNWLMMHGLQEIWPDVELPGWVERRVHEPAPGVPADGGQPLSRMMVAVWAARPDLRSAFDLATPAGRDGLATWFRSHGPARPAGAGRASPAAPVVRRGPPVPGVAVYGRARGAFGIGEDVRTTALALERAGVPVAVVDVVPDGADPGDDRRVDRLMAGAEAAAAMRAAVFCMTPTDHGRYALAAGADYPRGRAIGYWPWELQRFPDAAAPLFELVDEMWSSTRFAAAAMDRPDAPPVRHLPLAVTIDALEPQARAPLGIPGDAFVFLFVFDAFSRLSRKNPLAAVEAFRRAFPYPREPVRLLLKTMNLGAVGEQADALREAAARDPRIVLVDRTLSRGALLGLTALSDAMLSLHRAEGFGRTIAEAMLLRRPVVVSGYSGNLDFTTAETARLVGCRMVGIPDGAFPFGDGQSWAEPDVDEAAWHMRRLVTDDRERGRQAAEGQRLVARHYSLEATGRRYRAALEEAGLL